MIVGTAGHIDHGKTLLVKALTGVDTDRLKEEKARGITIELGFAYIPLDAEKAAAAGAEDMLGFVDVPGHERFVHTMLAGAASIDFVVLVVAADDGVMPQTREHLQILDLLGLSEGLVALNKVDLIDAARRREVEAEIRAALAGSTLAEADIVPVSARTGEGVAGLKTRLIEEALSRPERRSRGAFRMALDRSFTVAGAGTVVTGTVISGAIATGEQAVALPHGGEARVRTLHANGREAQKAQTGDRAALNLAGIERSVVGRGDWLVAKGHAVTTARFDVQMRLLGTEPRPLKTWTPVHFHLGTSAVAARVVLLEAETLAPGGRALAQVVLEQPLPVRFGDRFVVRDDGAERTMGGGTVVDPRAPQRRRRTDERRALLDALLEPDAASALDKLLALPPGLLSLDAFIVDRGLDVAAGEQMLADLELTAVTVEGERWTAAASTLDGLKVSAGTVLAAYHAAHPEQAGMGQEALRLAMMPRLAKPMFAAALQMLVDAGSVVVQAGSVRLPSHTSSLGAADQKLWERMLKLIEQDRHRPPQVREMAEQLGQPIASVRKLAKTMARLGSVVEVATDRFFLRVALIELGQKAQALSQESPTKMFGAAAFRDAAGCGRNVGIQILEYFDRQGLTLRKGDERHVVKDPLAALAKK
ncbi:MAG: selenocysteine-specific translation elongation factor [Hyphomicrobiaceae bacterium]